MAAGADLNTADSTGFTSLDHAIDNGHAEVAALLIAAGASVDGAEPIRLDTTAQGKPRY
jgi:ankyrin repeat protein